MKFSSGNDHLLAFCLETNGSRCLSPIISHRSRSYVIRVTLFNLFVSTPKVGRDAIASGLLCHHVLAGSICRKTLCRSGVSHNDCAAGSEHLWCIFLLQRSSKHHPVTQLQGAVCRQCSNVVDLIRRRPDPNTHAEKIEYSASRCLLPRHTNLEPHTIE